MKINIIAHPNSKKPRIEKDVNGITHIYVKEPAKEGRANEEVIRVLSGLYNIPKSQIKLISGAKSKSKVFEIS